MITVACLKWGDLYGPEYVNILRAMVKHNLSVEHKFVCFTENPTGLREDIEVRELPADLHGWWGKLFLFKEGTFAKGERVLFIDLDTVIFRDIDKLAEVEGALVGLRDFYFPSQWASGIMVFDGGVHPEIWDRWIAEGRPEIEGGDQAWIARVVPDRELGRLQDQVGRLVVSYKADRCQNWAPMGSAVICFHGQPKPHNCGSALVKRVWTEECNNLAGFIMGSNTSGEEIRARIAINAKRILPWLAPKQAHNKVAVLVGGGPSMRDKIGHIKARAARGQHIFTVNNSLNFLRSKGIQTTGYFMLDSRPLNAEFVKDAPIGPTYYISSQCDPSVFENLAGNPGVVVWHADNELQEMEILGPIAEDRGLPLALIQGGQTVLLRAMNVLYILGYRNIQIYGMDSSVEPGKMHHAYEQKQNDGEVLFKVSAGPRDFMAPPWMITQAEQFQEQWHTLCVYHGCRIDVHGSGLIPYLASILKMQYRESSNEGVINDRAS